MIESIGEISLEHANDANIPVDIWIRELDESSIYYPEYQWELRADNYMPRKSRLAGEQSYYYVGNTREELAELIPKYVVPLYQTALKKLNSLVSGECNNLYYWSAHNEY